MLLRAPQPLKSLQKALGRRLQRKDSLMVWDCLVDCQGAQSQKEGQEDQGYATELGGTPS